uniref:Uncharacterized protein n=1 Tax=Leersia perrieri TaxID=77586 RepID=A0A0D9V3F6_9ORYZ
MKFDGLFCKSATNISSSFTKLPANSAASRRGLLLRCLSSHLHGSLPYRRLPISVRLEAMGHAAAFLDTPRNPVLAGRVVGGGSDRLRRSSVVRAHAEEERCRAAACSDSRTGVTQAVVLASGLLSSSSDPSTAPAPSASLTRSTSPWGIGRRISIGFLPWFPVAQRT